MLRTLFCCARDPDVGMPSRVMDVYVFEGDRALVRAAVGVLLWLEGRLYGGREEVLGLLGWAGRERWGVGCEEEFMRGVRAAGKVEGRVAGG